MTDLRRNWEGREVDGLRLEECLGGSDHSAVFRSREGAVKLLRADRTEPRVALWQRTAQLAHPYLVRLKAMGRAEPDLLYVVTEYAEEDLSQVLPDRPLTAEEARELLEPVIEALAYLHGNGFVHGRLKPSNILVVNGHLKLSSDGLIPSGERVRKPWMRLSYDAPETADGPVTPAADVWSLGVTLVEALTQRRPAIDAGELILPDTVPPDLREIAQGCLEPDPRDRITIPEIRRLLRPAAEPRGRHNGRRNAAIAASVLGATALAGIVLYTRKAEAPRPPGPESAPAVVSQAPRGAQTPAPAAAVPRTDQSAEPPRPVPQAPPARNVEPPAVPEAAPLPAGPVVERVLPAVPAKALRTIRGKVAVEVSLQVNAAGDVSNAKISSPGPSRYFAAQALNAARRWRFAPQTASGEWRVRFVFRQNGPEAAARRIGGVR
ncbi:MAG TPA: TonB family protein [Bryobacteraceae bacterium]